MTRQSGRLGKPTSAVRGLKIDKRRSWRKSLSEAQDLFVRNPLALARSLWIPSVIVALGLAAMVLFEERVARLLASVVVLYGEAVLARGVRVLACDKMDAGTRVMTSLSLREGLRLPAGGAIWAWLLLLIYAIVGGGIVVGLMRLARTPDIAMVAGLGVVVCLLLSVPAVLGLSRAVDSPAGGLSALPEGLRLAGRRFGSTLAMNFIIIVVLGILAFLFFLPTYVLGLAQAEGRMASALGDAAGLPSAVGAWRVVLCVVWGWVCAMLSTIWWLAGLLHLRSIEAKK